MISRILALFEGLYWHNLINSSAFGFALAEIIMLVQKPQVLSLLSFISFFSDF